jgi:hypothetical protein
MSRSKKDGPRGGGHRHARNGARGCKNHGGCGWCEGNRQYASTKAEAAADAELQQALTHLAQDLMARSRPMPAEERAILTEHLWELYE